MEITGNFVVINEFSPPDGRSYEQRQAKVGANGVASGSFSASAGAAISHGYSQHRGELFDINGDGIADSVNTVMNATEAYGDVRKAVHHCADDQIYPWKLQGILS